MVEGTKISAEGEKMIKVKNRNLQSIKFLQLNVAYNS